MLAPHERTEPFANSSSVTCQWEKPCLENTLLVDAPAVTQLLFFSFRLPLVSISHIPSVAAVPLIVSRCRPCCRFSSVNIKWTCVSVSREPTLWRVCDSGKLYLSQLHRQLQCGDRHSQRIHELNELRLSVDINCASPFPSSLFPQLERFTEWKPDGSSLNTGTGKVHG